MNDPAAISGTFADFKLVKTRSAAQIVVEVPIEDADRVLRALGGVPQPGKETHVALARMATTKESLSVQEQSKERRPFDTLKRSQQAGILCNEGGFQKFLEHEREIKFTADMEAEPQAATAVRKICGVNSRADLDTVPGAGEKWDRLETDYRIWPGYEA